MKHTPTGITADRTKNQLTITWKDGHVSVYSFSLLRNACPCAECRGGHEHMRAEPDPEVFTLLIENSPRTQLNKIEAVGTYAITPFWEDGHQFGIYNWDFLRALCPCPVCRGK
jgi:DUF971 family protein